MSNFDGMKEAAEALGAEVTVERLEFNTPADRERWMDLQSHAFLVGKLQQQATAMDEIQALAVGAAALMRWANEYNSA